MKKIIAIGFLSVFIFYRMCFGLEMDGYPEDNLEAPFSDQEVVPSKKFDGKISVEIKDYDSPLPDNSGDHTFPGQRFVERNRSTVHQDGFMGLQVYNDSKRPEYYRRVIIEKGNKKYIFYDVWKNDVVGEVEEFGLDGLFDFYAIYTDNQISHQSELTISDSLSKKLEDAVSDKVSEVISTLKKSIQTDQPSTQIMVKSTSYGVELRDSRNDILHINKHENDYYIRLYGFQGLSIESLEPGCEIYNQFVELMRWIQDYSANNQEIEDLLKGI